IYSLIHLQHTIASHYYSIFFLQEKMNHPKMRYWLNSRLDSRILIKFLISLNLIFFVYQLFGFPRILIDKQNPCIVLVNSSFNSNSNASQPTSQRLASFATFIDTRKVRILFLSLSILLTFHIYSSKVQ